mmetsp:Transcript_30654/g.68739  ORF Transcript_30654/g.68739 Transcript_30654/m.68739 type:complete len:203 (-) Transcript_30654:298-906(-)
MSEPLMAVFPRRIVGRSRAEYLGCQNSQILEPSSWITKLLQMSQCMPVPCVAASSPAPTHSCSSALLAIPFHQLPPMRGRSKSASTSLPRAASSLGSATRSEREAGGITNVLATMLLRGLYFSTSVLAFPKDSITLSTPGCPPQLIQWSLPRVEFCTTETSKFERESRPPGLDHFFTAPASLKRPRTITGSIQLSEAMRRAS